MEKIEKIKEYLISEIDRIVTSLGYDFVGLDFVQESGKPILRVYIDFLNGIMVKDCEVVSRGISKFIDEDNNLPNGELFLEVSSPGLDRPLFTLGDYRKFTGNVVKIKLNPTDGGRKRFKGTLTGVSESGLVYLKDEAGEVHEIPFENILKGNIVYQYG